MNLDGFKKSAAVALCRLKNYTIFAMATAYWHVVAPAGEGIQTNSWR